MTASADALRDRLAEVGTTLAAREADHRPALDAARKRAEELRSVVAHGLDGYRGALASAGAEHLDVVLGEVRTDDKHARAIEFDLTRGRYRAIVTVKSRGEVTLVGPFRSGKTEGPCKSFPIDGGAELDAALSDFLVSFLEEASTP